MQIIYFLFFITILLEKRSSATLDIDEVSNDGEGDTKINEYDDTEIAEPERSNRKDKPKAIKNFVGTNLFGVDANRKKCFSAEDIALLATRRDFESLIPKDLPNCLLDDELARILMQYFYGAHQVIEKMAGGHSKMVAQRAFYDTLGGYLKYSMIPISRYSLYAGLVKLRTAENIQQLYSECKLALNTNGNGWKPRIADLNDIDIQIEPLKIIMRNEVEDTSCVQLDLLDERTPEDDNMIVALPRLDPQEKGLLGNIWLPFKRKRTFNLQADGSAFILLRYFELTTRCYNFQGVCQDTFNKKFKDWILENLEIHFGDDVLYPGLAATLRIIETLRRKNKGTVVVLQKTKAKRQKSRKFETLKAKANQMQKHTNDWGKEIFETKNPGLLDDYLEETNIEKDKECRMKYIYIAIGVSLVLLLVVFCAIAFTLYKKLRTNKSGKMCDLLRRKPRDDEEGLLSSKKSKKTANGNGDEDGNTSPPKTTKCFGLCSKKNDSPAVIETSSMDSDSGRENRKKVKTNSQAPQAKPLRSKTLTVNEKKRFSISKKNKQKDVDEKQPRTGGILKKGDGCR